MALPLMHEAWGGWPWLSPLWILFWMPARDSSFALVCWRRGAWCGRAEDGHPRAPAEILAERFARGEIDAAEYRARLNILRQ